MRNRSAQIHAAGEAKQAAVSDETTPDYSDIFHPVLQSESERVDAMNAPADAHADVYVTEANEADPADWAEQAADETAEQEDEQ